jgi:hypothetical protein
VDDPRRPKPELDSVRDAMREHDLRDEEEAEDAPAEDSPPDGGTGERQERGKGEAGQA